MIPVSANDSSLENPARNDESGGEAAALIEVRHEPALARYTIWRDGEPVGLTDYAISGHEVRFTHTEVNPIFRHEGLASILVEFALDDVRERTSLTVVAQCPYVRRWIHEHAEYQDLLTRGR